MWGVIGAISGLCVTILGSMLMLAFYVGKMAARVDSLEIWRSEMQHTLDSIYGEIRRVGAIVPH